jgi:hypothetical protein
MAKYSIKVPLPTPLKPKEREKIADAILTHIVGRTMAGLDKENKKFAKYSKDYAEFKGVSRSDVDLILSGEMLTELKVLKTSPDFIEIGYSGSKELVGKVEGNILGTYGQPEPIPGKARDFLGIDESDVDVLIDAYEEEDFNLTEEEVDKIARDAAREILGNIDFNTDVDGTV